MDILRSLHMQLLLSELKAQDCFAATSLYQIRSIVHIYAKSTRKERQKLQHLLLSVVIHCNIVIQLGSCDRYLLLLRLNIFFQLLQMIDKYQTAIKTRR